MYYKDKNQRVTVRLTDEEWKFVLRLCSQTGKSPSEMIRFCVDNVALSYALTNDYLGGVSDGIDHETDINDFI